MRRGHLTVFALGAVLLTLAAACGGTSTQASKPAPAPRRAFGPEDVGKSILSGAASAATEQAMTQLGLPTTANQLAALQNSLNQINNRITQIQTFLADAQLEGRCEAARNKGAEILSLIEDGQQKLKEASAPADQAVRETRLKELDSYIYNTLDSRQLRLHNLLVGKSEQSLISECGKYLESKAPRLFTKDDSSKIWTFMANYGYAESVLNGLRKGYRVRKGYTDAEVQDLEAKFKAQVADQDALVKPVLPANTFVNRSFVVQDKLWRMTPGQRVTVNSLKTGYFLVAWVQTDRREGWKVSGYQNSDPTCSDIIQTGRGAPNGRFGDWLRARGMLNTTGANPERIACWRDVYSDDPSITGYLKMLDSNALDNYYAPPSPVSTQVNVIELKKIPDRYYSYLS
jgi:hypothetical protein